MVNFGYYELVESNNTFLFTHEGALVAQAKLTSGNILLSLQENLACQFRDLRIVRHAGMLLP